VLGLLGNSGNTDAPHLHFHMMDGPAPLASNGLPYEFTSFEGQGVASSLDPMMAGKAAPIDGAALAGPHSGQLPLNLQVISFPVAAPPQ
jgi:murein DD-endopeptidase MepM/ murein hydrolase activator NlpD